MEVAFYIQVISTPYTGMNDAEKSLLTDIRDHEIIHRDFFKAALGANAIKDLEVNFSAIEYLKYSIRIRKSRWRHSRKTRLYLTP